MLAVLLRVEDRDLVRAPEVLDLVSVDLLGASPPLGRAQNDHRPAWPSSIAVFARALLNRADLQDTALQRARHYLVHLVGITSFHEMRRVAVSAEQGLQFVVRDSRKHGR